jgi:predicted rRNA methylase YqxC with S4 and FtsJ domains
MLVIWNNCQNLWIWYHRCFVYFIENFVPVVKNWFPETGGQLVQLIKPQFEAGKSELRGRRVIRDSAIHRRVLEDVLGFAQELGFSYKT